MRQSTRISDRQRNIENLDGKRKWKQHEGKNRFYCDGRVMTTKQTSIFLLTAFIIIVTFVLFCIFDLPYLTENVSVLLPIAAGILFIFVFANLLKTTFTDPGIIPRPSNREAIEYDKQCAESADISTRTGTGNSNAPRVKIVSIKGQQVKLKFCFTCRIFRPARASHCSICDNCVLNFDHHCPWVGNCIGLRNYRYFYFFITSLALLDLFIGACTVTHLAMVTNETKAFIETIRVTPVSLVIALICLISIWSVLGLSGFHTYLMVSSMTTNEDIKGTFNTKLRPSVKNPYSTGNGCKNIFYGLCSSEPPGLLDRRGVINSNEVITIDADAYQRIISLTTVQNNASELMEISLNNDHQNDDERKETIEDEIDDDNVDDTECMPRHSFVSIPRPHCSNGGVNNDKVSYTKDNSHSNVTIPMDELNRKVTNEE